ncbi:glycine--tRNA ligase subunit beta [Sulfurimonas autotrophica]|uniref:Glycine--tRNA ligase beta subunit n=1 Tax=Sulfurimonas autotrophica (strain ATCC BAA-671 / DSM 16294 / JCM 11897 / OK10) TaxID=563040 RepID=E0UTH8_SULAO|nr:glycine--tRNA ligase subunit beta [Sulfurimonas autotrophica]ADN09343.1 glycyl-tRNA synthetase beta chain [Sulfurimonas autotrophica DSM 16294]
MLKPLLIEIGVEELPAVPLLKEMKNIERKYADILEKYSLLSEFEFYYTPRRLVMWHREFKTGQDDSAEEFFGAPLAVAYKDGTPTKAAEGFARKCGVSLEELSTANKGGKEVLYYKKDVAGKPSAELLPEIIYSWLKSLDFGKSMRWGSLHESFIRPIRWVNVQLDDTLVPMYMYGVDSSKITRVHRIANFNPVEITGAKDYFETLKNGGVTLFQQEREEKILGDIKAIEKDNSVNVEIDDDLFAEVVAITENPTALLGSFDEAFLRLPPEVIITSMKEHQRYFPVFKDGQLVNKFVVVSNALSDDFSEVIAGNERVLRPRLADGLFFYDNDLKNGLSTKGLEKVAFFKGLGSVADKIEREEKIADALYDMYQPDAKKEDLNRAIELAKADLMSEMVYEFTELQGLMGYYYAKEAGENDAVALAIKEQYLPEGEESELPSTPLSAIVAMSIKLDTLLGLFSVNEIPTGSRDPFALRRAVNGIIRIVNEYGFEFDIVKTLKELSKNYDAIDLEKLENFILERIRRYYKVNPSIIEAVLASDERELLALGRKIAALNTLVNSEGFDEVSSTFKRVANITKDIDLNGDLNVDESLFEEEAEKTLYKRYKEVTSKTYESYEEELDALLGLKPELDLFFDSVMVNAEDDKIKNNRKALVASIYKSILNIADIKEVSI